MRNNFAGNAFVIFMSGVVSEVGAIFDQGFLGVGCFAVNETDETNQLIPRLAMNVSVLASVDGGEFPFLLPGKRLDGSRQVGSKRFLFVWRPLQIAGLPKIGTQIQVLHAQTISLTQ